MAKLFTDRTTADYPRRNLAMGSRGGHEHELVNQPANIERITTPLLIANAMQDSLVDPEPTKKFAAICKCAQSLELEDAQHEVLQEIDSIRDLFFEAFDKFISQIQTETQASTSTPKASATER